MKQLSKVIEVDAEKCVNCHACIAACPVKFCNDGSGDHVTVDQNLCIGCGNCIRACTHDARKGVDNFDEWLEAMRSNETMIAISAPAVAANFPDTYLHLHGWLQSLGVEDFFDVSFGAELTVKSYLEYMKEKSPKTVIAQPCPAIVSYIEIYQPELIPHLAPADSPMLHVMKMIREYYPEYHDHKILVLSPCLAKRREFDATGVGDYNVTYNSLVEYIEKRNIDLTRYPKVSFTADQAERAVTFSKPGGLQKTVERENPEAAAKTRKIEGPDIIYEYLKKLPDMIKNDYAPPLIDCLNCEMGCNGGPGTINQEKSPDEIEYHIEKRNEEMMKQYKNRGVVRSKWAARRRVQKNINSYWKPGLYDRSYSDRSENYGIQYPTNSELEEVYRKMKKYSKSDFLNCRACGYGSCELMATAIFNGLNQPENCFHYSQVSRIEMTNIIFDSIRDSTDRLSKAITHLTESEGRGEDELVSMQDIAEISRGMRKSIEEGLSYIENTIETMESIRSSNSSTAEKTEQLNDQVKEIGEIVSIITSITEQTKIIAFNAELEASSAGEAGKTFQIVAGEIRRLANNTANSTEEITKKIKNVQVSSQELSESRKMEEESVARGTEAVHSLQNIFTRLADYSAESDQKINKSIESQVRTFQQTLEELEKVGKQMDTFGTDHVSRSGEHVGGYKDTGNDHEDTDTGRDGDTGRNGVRESAGDTADAEGNSESKELESRAMTKRE